jgi:hypothetical protein
MSMAVVPRPAPDSVSSAGTRYHLLELGIMIPSTMIPTFGLLILSTRNSVLNNFKVWLVVYPILATILFPLLGCLDTEKSNAPS